MKNSLIVLEGLLLALILSSFSASLSAAPTGGKVTFGFGGFSERQGIIFVAKDTGLFRKYGLHAEIVHVRNGQVGIAAIASGETQFHLASPTGGTIGAIANGLDLVWLAGLINKLDGTIVVAPNIRTPADLREKRFGLTSIGGGPWMFTVLAFDHWGLNAERDRIQLRAIGDQGVPAQALAAGNVDAAYLGYTYAAQLERRGFRVLADLTKLGIPFQGMGILSRRSFIERSPAIAEKAVRVFVEANGFIQDPNNKNAVVQSLAKGLRLTKTEDAEVGYEMMKSLYDKRVYPNVDGVRNVIRLLGKTSELIRRLKPEDLVDDRIVRKLEKEGLF